MIPFVQLSFLFTCIYYIKYQQDILGLNTIVPVYIAITGILIIFTFFRKYETSFTQNRIIGKCLQYIGKRTLDVYLLHYFFLPYGFHIKSLPWGKIIAENPALELTFALFLAGIIMCLCLITSNILRTSPLLGHYLFGVKLPK